MIGLIMKMLDLVCWGRVFADRCMEMSVYLYVIIIAIGSRKVKKKKHLRLIEKKEDKMNLNGTGGDHCCWIIRMEILLFLVIIRILIFFANNFWRLLLNGFNVNLNIKTIELLNFSRIIFFLPILKIHFLFCSINCFFKVIELICIR